MSPTIRNQVKLAGIALVAAVALTMSADVAFAQSGHFNDRTWTCTDIGTQVECSGKVSGLGGTTFQVTLTASGIGSVECTNPGGNVAPGQDTAIAAEGDSGQIPTPRNGNFTFDGANAITTVAPVVPNTPTCPNAGWTATVVDVMFTSDATLTLTEDGVVSDTLVVPIASGA
jgi:hypothetical protein